MFFKPLNTWRGKRQNCGPYWRGHEKLTHTTALKINVQKVLLIKKFSLTKLAFQTQVVLASMFQGLLHHNRNCNILINTMNVCHLCFTSLLINASVTHPYFPCNNEKWIVTTTWHCLFKLLSVTAPEKSLPVKS